jgi:hypothetical protein
VFTGFCSVQYVPFCLDGRDEDDFRLSKKANLKLLRGYHKMELQWLEWLVEELKKILLGMNVLRRGERARALEWLWYVQRYLLQLIRINERKTDRWVNPTKNLEHDIKDETY